MNISIEVGGEQQLYKAFTKVENTVSDLTPVWKAVQKKFFEIEQDQFQSEGAKGASGKWQPLSKAYERIKIQKYGSFALLAGVLIATSDLYKSLTRKTGDSIEVFEKMEAAFGTSLPYARKHQEGRGRLPARPPISLSDASKRELGKVITKGLLPYLKKTTLTVNESNFKDIG